MDRVDQLSTASGLTFRSRPAVAAAWSTFTDAAQALHLDEDTLAAFVAPRLTGADLETALAAAPAADLVLAAACAAQAPGAHAAFERILSEVDAAGAVTHATADTVLEVKQLLRVQLLVPREGKPAGIDGYRGKGPLRGWVRITATRELIRHKKKQSRALSLDDRSLDRLLSSGVDPALAAMKAEYRAEFAAALREAIDDLSAEDRTLLRQQIVDDMSIDAVGAAYGVHRATAARWLNRARAALVAATHHRLAARLDVPVEQVDSVIRLVSSQLDASVIRFLKDR